MTKVHVHFLGIGGSGASAAAAIAEAQGYEITGCDLKPNNEFTTEFKPTQLLTDHDPKHLNSHSSSGTVDILAVTPAIYSLDPDNSELLKASKRGIEIMTWQQFLGKYLTKDKFVIAVCGTHGKTTTTAIISKLLEDAGLDPTVILGAITPWWNTNYRIGKSQYFVAEADEFNDNFLPTHPDISVVTNIEMDHPEYFKDFESYKESFKKFLLQTRKTIVANLSDPGVKQTLNVHPGGVNTIIDYSKYLIDFSLKIPGEFNKWNASAAFQVGLLLGIDPETIQRSLSSYTGVSRRFEYLGDIKGAKIYTDFGHHPTEIKATMEAARQKFPKQYIWLIFQPHMFSRTKALFSDFTETLKSLATVKTVNQILLTDIYPSREKDTGLVKSLELVDAIDESNVDYVSSEKELKEIIRSEIGQGDILFFMGAGDIDKIAKELVTK